MLVYLNQALTALKEKATESGTAISVNDYREALIEGAGLRVRPVMMTVATIIIGLLPILYGSGTGSEVMSRIAAPMVGGVTSAVLLTLVVLPAIYSLVKYSEINSFNKQFD